MEAFPSAALLWQITSPKLAVQACSFSLVSLINQAMVQHPEVENSKSEIQEPTLVSDK